MIFIIVYFYTSKKYLMQNIDPDLELAIKMSKEAELLHSRPKNRCSFVIYDDSCNILQECKNRLTLAAQVTGKCRCGFSYCSDHRIQHNCTFDFHKMAKDKLSRENQEIKTRVF